MHPGTKKHSHSVPVTRLRGRYQYFLKLGYTPSEIAAWCGYNHPHNEGGDGRRLERDLGYKPILNARKGQMGKRRYLYESTALRIAEALALDPVDIGL